MRDELDNNEIAGLLQTLPRVDAPKDFDFKVKARIAAGRPATRGVPVWVKAAVPLALVIAIGGYFGYRSLNLPSQPDVQSVAIASPQTAPVAAPVVEQPTTKPAEIVTADPQASNSTLATAKKPSAKRGPQGGSIDQAVKIGRQIDLNERSATDAFAAIGVKGSLDASGLKVDSAATNSGLKSGDVVESVNGQPVTDKTTVKGRLSGKTVRVLRDGKTVDVVIKN